MVSQHPVDRLIRELIQTKRSATLEEVEQILERMVMAPFNPWPVRVPQAERGASYQRHVLGARVPSLAYHLVKRVAIEEQWAPDTTAADYTDDLGAAVRASDARLAVYERRGDHAAAVIARTEDVLPAERLGARWQPNILVTYSASRGIIVTGYQFSTLDRIAVPQEALWLR